MTLELHLRQGWHTRAYRACVGFARGSSQSALTRSRWSLQHSSKLAGRNGTGETKYSHHRAHAVAGGSLLPPAAAALPCSISPLCAASALAASFRPPSLSSSALAPRSLQHERHRSWVVGPSAHDRLAKHVPWPSPWARQPCLERVLTSSRSWHKRQGKHALRQVWALLVLTAAERQSKQAVPSLRQRHTCAGWRRRCRIRAVLRHQR